MPRKTHPAAAVMNYFRTQPKDVCDLTLALIKDEMKMRIQGLKTTPVKNPKRKAASPKETSPDLDTVD